MSFRVDMKPCTVTKIQIGVAYRDCKSMEPEPTEATFNLLKDFLELQKAAGIIKDYWLESYTE